MWSRIVGLGAAFLTLAMAPPASAKEAQIFAKPGVGPIETQAQWQRCWDEARGVKAPSAAAPYTPSNSVAAAAGAGLAIGIMQGYMQAKAQGGYVDDCMRQHGFGKITLTADEAAGLAAAKSQEARGAWFDSFLAKDLSARVAAALIPAVPPFAPAAAEPYAVGGLRLDPATVKVYAFGILPNQMVLTAKASHRRTAVLKADFRVAGLLDQRAEAGAVFHQVSYRAQAEVPGATAWCGPVANNSIRGRITMPFCIWSTFDGYRVAQPLNGESWLAGAGSAGAPVMSPASELLLDESDGDLLGPVEVSLNLARLTKAGAFLEAVAAHDGKKVVFWEGFVALDAEGRGELPFWRQRLRIVRKEGALRASLTDDGDGSGWLDRKPAG
jgi:hypothetical protein